MTEDFSKFETEELEEFIEAYARVDRSVRRPESLFSILPGSREESYQYTLQYFLDPQKPHRFRYMLLETFFECIGFNEVNLTGQHVEIEDEVRIVDDEAAGYIDLVICGGSSLSDHPRWAVFWS